MKKNVLSQSLPSVLLVLCICSTAFAQVGGAGGDKVTAHFVRKAKTLVSLSEMLITAENAATVVSSKPAVVSKRKLFARKGREKSGLK